MTRTLILSPFASSFACFSVIRLLTGVLHQFSFTQIEFPRLGYSLVGISRLMKIIRQTLLILSQSICFISKFNNYTISVNSRLGRSLVSGAPEWEVLVPSLSFQDSSNLLLVKAVTRSLMIVSGKPVFQLIPS